VTENHGVPSSNLGLGTTSLSDLPTRPDRYPLVGPRGSGRVPREEEGAPVPQPGVAWFMVEGGARRSPTAPSWFIRRGDRGRRRSPHPAQVGRGSVHRLLSAGLTPRPGPKAPQRERLGADEGGDLAAGDIAARAKVRGLAARGPGCGLGIRAPGTSPFQPWGSWATPPAEQGFPLTDPERVGRPLPRRVRAPTIAAGELLACFRLSVSWTRTAALSFTCPRRSGLRFPLHPCPRLRRERELLERKTGPAELKRTHLRSCGSSWPSLDAYLIGLPYEGQRWAQLTTAVRWRSVHLRPLPRTLPR
jgi:hypothetical protein